jgi:hypothetical protein
MTRLPPRDRLLGGLVVAGPTRTNVNVCCITLID